MADQMKWLNVYSEALAAFVRDDFEKAALLCEKYQRLRNCDELPRDDRRASEKPAASVIIVSRNGGHGLVRNLNALEKQTDRDFEVVLIDNGGNDSIHDQIADYPLLHVIMPLNMTPSEGRNIGAHFARGDLYFLLDDDGIPAPDWVEAGKRAMRDFDLIAIRGRVLPLENARSRTFQGHYDLGPNPVPAILETEGNAVVAAKAWKQARGMDPLMFGAEGAEFSQRLLKAFPGRDILYWPLMVLFHDYAEGADLAAKKERHRRADAYLEFKGSSAGNLAAEYGRWRQARPPGTVAYDQRTVPQRIWAGVREAALKRIPHRPSPSLPTPETEPATEWLPPRKAAEQARRMRLLEDNLSIIRKSYSYRTGKLFADALTSPVSKGLRLPCDLFKLVSEIIKKTFLKQRQIQGKDLRNTNEYVAPGREVHRCRLFPPVEIFKKKSASRTRFACICGMRLLRCLSFDVHATLLRSSGRHFPDGEEITAVLVEPEGFRDDPAWLETISGRTRFRAFAENCRRKGIPLLFLHSETMHDIPGIHEAAEVCDHVFSTGDTRRSVAELFPKTYRGDLPPAVQPALHNPLLRASDPLPENFSIFFDGWADMLEYPRELPGLLAPLKEAGIHVVDSRTRFMANKLSDLPDWKERVLGCITDDERLNALRHYPVTLLASPTLETETARVRKALEALACGSSVICLGGSPLPLDPELAAQIPEEALQHVHSGKEAARAAALLLSNSEQRQAAVHKARRTLFNGNTYADRLDTMLHAAGIEADTREHPPATIITPTKRPHQIAHCLKQFDAQSYPEKQLVLVVNRSDADMEQIRAEIGHRPDVHVFAVHEGHNIGACLNAAADIAQDGLWFKMDDDDIYGEHYVSDMILERKASDAEIFGKVPAYIYLEDEDALLKRIKKPGSHRIVSNEDVQLCGATLSGTIQALKANPFAEDMRSCVDTVFFRQRPRGMRLHTMNPYNFITCRSKDKTGHTWRLPDAGIAAEGIRVCSGTGKDKVIF